MRDPLRPHKQAAPTHCLLHHLTHPLHLFNLQVKIHPTSRCEKVAVYHSTWDLEVDERGVELGSHIGTLELSLSLVVTGTVAANRSEAAGPVQGHARAGQGGAQCLGWGRVHAFAGGAQLLSVRGGDLGHPEQAGDLGRSRVGGGSAWARAGPDEGTAA
ncbi:uncharacterized protein [Zea mays]|jgi:hypothetical protein|uniref:Uncharacterized protein n=1 Tax=Zea mays TaxID=4577 RepID=C0PH52_MAIZE|nr:uncharacterized protein LOC118476686 [Zea mays]ACN34518.1 unknown [Zea mays]